MSWTQLLTLISLGSTLCSGTILQNVADLNSLNLKFDYIVVGGDSLELFLSSLLTTVQGGTAGNVVANRLSENSAKKVLVLEAGGS
jgi:hypothetical protein